jgi:formate hydrogenlyase subunit 4
VHFVLGGNIGLEVSLGLALVSLTMVAIAENGRIPIDNPATHLELTMVHEAMVLEYSGRHLALIELASMVRLQMYISLILCMFVPWGITQSGGGPTGIAIGLASYMFKLFVGGAALAIFETSIAKMRVFRVADFLGGALLLAILATIFLYISEAV